jgi:hypothetical protein
MSVHIVASFGYGSTTEAVVDAYLWGNVNKISPAIHFGSRSFVILEAETLWSAESQRDRLGSGLIGARVIQSAEDMETFFADMS